MNSKKSHSKLAITIVATKEYQYALNAQARAIQQNVLKLEGGDLILVTDKKPATGIIALYNTLLGSTWQVHHIPINVTDGHPNYKENAQLTIAQLRSEAFGKARSLKVDYCWSLDSDVLPPANALRCMMDMQRFDAGYYSITTCPYVSQGGGGFLFGRGTIQRNICEDVYEDERIIPEELAIKLKEHRDIQPKDKRPSEEWITKMQLLEEELKKCQPKGNIFELNAKGWRKRGWGEMAYPAIGKGSVVPTDWCGFGCTLMNKEALSLADFSGYEGKGTEDLFVVWRKWYPNNLRICSIPHVLCAHVIRKKDKGGYVLVEGFHETEGELVGHIRQRQLPWYSHDPGETIS